MQIELWSYIFIFGYICVIKNYFITTNVFKFLFYKYLFPFS